MEYRFAGCILSKLVGRQMRDQASNVFRTAEVNSPRGNHLLLLSPDELDVGAEDVAIC